MTENLMCMVKVIPSIYSASLSKPEHTSPVRVTNSALHSNRLRPFFHIDVHQPADTTHQHAAINKLMDLVRPLTTMAQQPGAKDVATGHR